METKYCNGCERELSVNEFDLRMRRGKVVRRSRCKTCEKAEGKAYQQKIVTSGVLNERLRATYLNNSSRFKKQNIRSFARKLQIQPEKLLNFIAEHEKVCDICGKPESPTRRLDIDHNHATNDVRGLLCSQCNVGLGYFADEPALLQRAAEYLAKQAAVKSEGKPIPLPEIHASSKQDLFLSMLNVVEESIA